MMNKLQHRSTLNCIEGIANSSFAHDHFNVAFRVIDFLFGQSFVSSPFVNDV